MRASEKPSSAYRKTGSRLSSLVKAAPATPTLSLRSPSMAHQKPGGTLLGYALPTDFRFNHCGACGIFSMEMSQTARIGK